MWFVLRDYQTYFSRNLHLNDLHIHRFNLILIDLVDITTITETLHDWLPWENIGVNFNGLLNKTFVTFIYLWSFEKFKCFVLMVLLWLIYYRFFSLHKSFTHWLTAGAFFLYWLSILYSRLIRHMSWSLSSTLIRQYLIRSLVPMWINIWSGFSLAVGWT